MQDPAPISFEHDGFVAHFSSAGGAPLLVGCGAPLLGGLVLVSMQVEVISFLFAFVFFGLLFLGAVAVGAMQVWQMAGTTLEGRSGQLRIRRGWGSSTVLSTAEVTVRVELQERAGTDETRKTLVLETPGRTWRLRASRWSTDELHGLAELVREMEEGRFPEPPESLRRLRAKNRV